MKRKYRVTVLILLVFSALFIYDVIRNQAHSSASGPVAARTGSPGDGGANCTGCHSGPAPVTQTGWITSTIPANGYVAGATYTITATAFGPGHVRFGFQICPQNTAGLKLGTLLITDATNTKLTSGYISHTSAGTIGTANSHTWTFNWTAPAVGSGDVTFYGAFLITNNSNSTIGDTCYYSRLTVSEAPCIAPSQPGSITSVSSVCAGGSLVFSVAPVSGATSYSWSLPSGWTGNSTTNTISAVAGAASGTVSVAAVNSCGSSPSSSTFITVNPRPSATITPSGSTTFCQGGSVTLSVQPGNAYLWSPGGSTSSSLLVSSSGNYSVTVTNSNGCTSSSSQSVTVNSLPSASISASGPTTFCQGGSVLLTATGGVSYLWSPGGSTSSSISAFSSGTYSVVVTNTNGCTSSSSQSVNVLTAPAAVISPSGSTSFCQGGAVTLNASGGNSYLWSPGGITSSSLNVTSSGSYSVIVTGSNNCTSSATQTVTVFTPPNVQINASGPLSFCRGESVNLSASGGISYSWSPGGSTSSGVTIDSSGTYSVTATDANSCTASATVVASVLPLPTAAISASGPTSFCDGGSVTLDASGGTAYQWSPNGEPSSTINATSSGTYTVTVSDGNNCTSSSSIVITVHPLPTVSLDPFADVCDTSAAFVLSGGIPFGGIYLVDLTTTSVFDPGTVGAGMHSIAYSYTDLNSCTFSVIESIEVLNCSPNFIPSTTDESIQLFSDNHGVVYLFGRSESDPLNVYVMNTNGLILQQSTIVSGNPVFDTHNLAAGIYLVRIVSASGNQLTKRILINH